MKSIRIANGQGFWGDSIDAPVNLINQLIRGEMLIKQLFGQFCVKRIATTKFPGFQANVFPNAPE